MILPISLLLNAACLARLIYLHFAKKYTLERFRFFAVTTVSSSIIALLSLMGTTSMGDFFAILNMSGNQVIAGALASQPDFRCILIGVFLICVEVVFIVYIHESWVKQIQKNNEAGGNAGNGEKDKKKGLWVDLRIRYRK